MSETVAGRFPGMRRDQVWTILQIDNNIAIIRSKNRIAAIHLKSGFSRLSARVRENISTAHLTYAAGGRETTCPIELIRKLRSL
jgi:hypothetical protein